jgi:hypothetical protein
MKLNIAVYNGNVMAFKFQSTSCEVIEAEVDAEYINQPIFTEHQIPQFYLDNGIVKKRTDDEIKAMPEYNEYMSLKRAEAYKQESDALFFKYQRGEVTEQDWLDKVQEIKDRYPKN